ncbi:MAG: DUF6789 family protein [Bradyrhizobium sp.]
MNSPVNYGKGVLAGFVATIVLSAIMLMKQAMGVMPQLNPIEMITTMAGASTPLVGWIGHFVIGAILWGVIYAWLDPRLPGPHWIRGMIFATGAWFIMMVIMMPMAGAGFFGANLGLGMKAPVATLMLHWIYGAVLGGVYHASTRRGSSRSPPSPRAGVGSAPAVTFNLFRQNVSNFDRVGTGTSATGFALR